MFLLVRRIWNSCPFSIFGLLPLRVFSRVLGTIRLLLGIQQVPYTEPDAQSNLPTRAEAIEESASTVSGQVLELEPYCPSVEKILGYGSTSIIGRVRPGVVIKYPRYLDRDCPPAEVHKFVEDIKHSFDVERQILDILGQHANIISFLGHSKDPTGLLFAEANCGNLQDYLDHHNDTIDVPTRLMWRLQAAEAIKHLHLKGVIHSDLRPANFLLHSDINGILNLYLSDFGGSTCGDIDGGHLPDSGFFDPRKPWVSTEDTDIFSLGSVFYAIMTGHWPYKCSGSFTSSQEMERYMEKVDELFSKGKFPAVEGLAGGHIITGCWIGDYKDVGAIQVDQTLMLKEFMKTD